MKKEYIELPRLGLGKDEADLFYFALRNMSKISDEELISQNDRDMAIERFLLVLPKFFQEKQLQQQILEETVNPS